MDVRLGIAAGFATVLFAATEAAADLGESLTAAERRAVAASGLPRASIVSAKPDMVVAIRGRGTPSQGGGVIEGVTLHGEVVSSQASQTLGYRSMRSTVNIDCVRRRDMVVKMTVFTEANAKGVAINRHVPGGWVQPSPDAYLSDVIRAVCASAPRQAAAAPMEPASAARDDEDRPLRTALDARAGRASPPTPAPAAEVPEQPAPTSSAKAAPKSAPPPAPVSAKAGKVAVQIAAASTDGQARAALAQIRGRLAPPLAAEVRSAVVDGRTYHRALVTGFRTRAEAQTFCASLRGACFVR